MLIRFSHAVCLLFEALMVIIYHPQTIGVDFRNFAALRSYFVKPVQQPLLDGYYQKSRTNAND